MDPKMVGELVLDPSPFYFDGYEEREYIKTPK